MIPQSELLQSLESYQPKIDPKLVEEIWRTIGLQVTDRRLLAVASAMLESQMLKIVSEVKCVNSQK